MLVFFWFFSGNLANVSPAPNGASGSSCICIKRRERVSSVSLQAHASNPRQQGEETTGCGYSMMCCEHVHNKHELGDLFFSSPCCIMCGKCRYCFSLFREKCVSAGHSKIFDFPRANRQKWTFYDRTEKRTMEGGKGKNKFLAFAKWRRVGEGYFLVVDHCSTLGFGWGRSRIEMV